MDGLNTITNNDLLQAVRESAMLAEVTIGVWSAVKNDKNITDKIRKDAGAVGQVGRFTKNLLAGADSQYKNVVSAYQAVRQLHYQLTLPWVSDPHATRQAGPRLLPHLLFQKYLSEVGALRQKAKNELDSFLVVYPTLVIEARANLGSLADVTYPDEQEVRSKFRIHFDFQPIPEGGGFKGLDSFTLERLSQGLEARQKQMIITAQKSMWDEVKSRVGHIVKRLSDPENKFKEATLTNTRKLLELLPGWNLAQAPEVDVIIADIKNMLDGVDGKLIRKNPDVRRDVTARARTILDKMGAFGL